MSDTYDLQKLLDKYEVTVPIIQRDYAQGRKDKGYIRKTFLTEIKKHLENNNSITLDFVYGNIEGGRFYPLDGQQRLTTLWLLYWYISLRAGKLEEDKKFLSKFSYETRASSAEFCSALCNKDIPKDVSKIVDYIKSQTWFYASWLQDPTINAMLRTLGGDSESKSDSSKNDNIEIIFADADYVTFRDKLLNSSIVNFELMVIGNEKLPISDDLYVKMNARGKALTDFEDFKADLVAWIHSDKNSEKVFFLQPVPGKALTYMEYYPAKIDNDWADVFWESARQKLDDNFKGKIDDIYFSFLNRYVLNEMCLNEEISSAEYADGKENDAHKDFKVGVDKLYEVDSNSLDNSRAHYESFDIYEAYITFDTLQKLDYIFKVIGENPNVIEKALMNIDNADNEDANEKKNSSSYAFIPRYDETGRNLVSTGQKERVYFLAISRFIENMKTISAPNFDEVKYNRWMRVVRNLVENAAVDSKSSMVVCMRLINKLADDIAAHSNDVYEALKNYELSPPDTRLKAQLKEEKEKAEKILEDEAWENKFVEAENYSFFSGTIRFLYTNGTETSWKDFDTKFQKARKLFKPNSNKVSEDTVKALLKQFTGFAEIEEKYLFTSIGYHRRNNCWKSDILCSGDGVVQRSVHNLLMEIAEPTHDENYASFIESGLVEKIVSRKDNYVFRYHWHYDWAVHRKGSQTEGVYVTDDRRTRCEELKQLIEKNAVELSNSAFNSYHQGGYYWGMKVTFKYKDVPYLWRVYYDKKTDKVINKIFKYENDTESKRGMTWDNIDALLPSIDSFNSWN